jgi:hypothetical protein
VRSFIQANKEQSEPVIGEIITTQYALAAPQFAAIASLVEQG